MTRYFEFGGGLGDIFSQIFVGSGYRHLAALPAPESATVGLITHNPFARELFTWLPGAGRLTILDRGYWSPAEDAEQRPRHGFPPKPPSSFYFGRAPVVFYPSPDDAPVLAELAMRPYVAFSASAGLPERDIPKAIVQHLAATAQARGFATVFLGRSYARQGRAEYRPSAEEGLDLVDRLSVPGTALAVTGAAALVCCHSALNLLAWHLRRPQFLLYPKSVDERHMRRPDEWSFGIGYPECRHALFEDDQIPVIAEAFFAELAGQRD